ncbi:MULTISPECIES: RNA polymerase factor sigma-54 [Flectobacillus]|jgi:RNA polymerase sigma-54 factor|uniref:RNA polymerase factor sigma-54 n=1 Tax=Flectobacillus roseus TaxID=502259 RepID=A0ABT6Y6X2_9BACT|nr:MULTISPECIES: RNA polymerase factor sigma-54 [Flectobacillus]MDI9858868.1 RNA polymerase factor sigma-54 [Flectobacillus roseus]MDI9870159.1 RNA polymerase factor sigma-54 [Flectobacillus roseus]NBA76538.1 RNA polymerase factor sigma-54 [Emticicia sp. ODNR4P]PAC27951.1 RNA polymerase sigma-54 factor [Flectobacillus sp. BAB-3569]
MQKLSLNQSLQQRLSPQQIQFIKLLQIPTFELAARIEEELEINPALEEGMEMDNDVQEQKEEFDEEFDDYKEDEFADYEDRDLDIDSYLHDDYSGYKMQGDGNGGEEEEKEMPIMMVESLTDHLNTQLGFLRLDETKETIGKQIIGSIEADGYIRRPMQAIVNDLAFTQGVYTSIEEVEEVLRAIQTFDPAGIAARDLKECLLLQLDRKSQNEPRIQDAIRIVDEYFDEFSKKHYEKIQKRLGITDEAMKEAISLITKLNPKPGASDDDSNVTQFLMPDFILTNNNGKLEIFLNSKNAPELRVSTSFHEMLETYDKSDKNNKSIKETVTFIKQKLDSAKWFIDAIKQRQQTLLKTMQAIVDYQKEFFLSGDESKLKPMILKDIANEIEMDISTVSRVASSKSVQTEFGLYLLKYFFSEGISTESGEDASSREVKNILKELIENEPKKNPLSDDKLEKYLNEKGYNIARRTVAKYREQLNIPVARLRKQL